MNVSIDKLQPEVWFPEGEIHSLCLKYEGKYIAWALIEANEKKEVKIWFISTHKRYRRLGLASKLIKMLQELYDSITTNIYSINDEGAQTLIKNGFIQTKSLFKKEEDILSWAKTKTEKEE